jgi:Uma2 family endonuclease
MSTPAPDPAVKFTYEDFVLFPDDGHRHELIDGEHYVTPSPLTKHQRIVLNLSLLLGPFVRKKKLGEVFLSPVDVVFSNLDVVVPDLVYVSNERSKIVTEKNLQGAPDLVVEILSESTRKTDEITKRRLYERFGVKEYWILDPVLDTAKVFHQGAKGFERAAELSVEANDALTSPLFPGLTMPLGEIFAAR